MEEIEEIDVKESHIIQIDNSLAKYKNLPIFEEKVNKANDTLRTTELPKIPKKAI